MPVEPERSVVDVEFIKLLLQFEIRVASFGYLPKTCKPRCYRTTLFTKVAVHRLEVILWKGSWSDYGHLPCNNVHQLWEFIETR